MASLVTGGILGRTTQGRGPILKAGNKSSRHREEERSPKSVVSSFHY